MRDDEFTFLELGPRLAEAALELLPRSLERVAAGDPGDPQSSEGATWAGHFGEDYVEVDWSQSAQAIHRQVRAWAFASPSALSGPIAEIDGRRVRLVRTSLSDPGDGARRVEAGDAPIWIVEFEPVNVS
jgi:methionyl-tRNA formyltransferase